MVSAISVATSSMYYLHAGVKNQLLDVASTLTKGVVLIL